MQDHIRYKVIFHTLDNKYFTPANNILPIYRSLK